MLWCISLYSGCFLPSSPFWDGMGVDAVMWFGASLPPRALCWDGSASGGGGICQLAKSWICTSSGMNLRGPSGLQGVFSSQSLLLLCSPQCCDGHRRAGRLGLYRHLISPSFTSQVMLTCQLPSFQALSFSFFVSRQQ